MTPIFGHGRMQHLPSAGKVSPVKVGGGYLVPASEEKRANAIFTSLTNDLGSAEKVHDILGDPHSYPRALAEFMAGYTGRIPSN